MAAAPRRAYGRVMDNLRGSILMVLAMLGFAVEDMFIKQMAGRLPVGEILLALGLGGTFVFGAIAEARGDRLVHRDFLKPQILLRNGLEMGGTVCFVTALALVPISTASAILQATPLAVTLGAALFLKEAVGWRRWLAVALGLFGVLLVVRPGMEGFDPNALFAVGAVIGLGGRDLVTRRIGAEISTLKLSTYAFLAVALTGALLLAFGHQQPVVPDRADTVRLVAAVVIGMVAYYLIVMATRIGDLSVVSPFRYTRLVFALIIGVLAFGERPDALTLTGAAIIVASGIYALWREARVRRASLQAPPLV